MEEIWRPIPGYEGYYCVSNLGSVYSLRAGHKIKPFICNGYAHFNLRVDGIQKVFLGHRLVYCTFNRISLEFKGHKELSCVLHKDDDRLNNRIDNLVIGTQLENVADMVVKQRNYRRFTDRQICEIRSLRQGGMTQTEIAIRFKTSQSIISRIILKKTYFRVCEKQFD